MQDDRRDGDPRATSAVTSPGVKGEARSASRRYRARSRRRSGRRAGARRARSGSGSGCRSARGSRKAARGGRGRRPRDGGRRSPARAACARPGGQHGLVAGAASAVRARAAAQLDHPAAGRAAGQRRREVEPELADPDEAPPARSLETLTTSRSPGSSTSTTERKGSCSMLSSPRRATSITTAIALLGGRVRLEAVGQLERERPHARLRRGRARRSVHWEGRPRRAPSTRGRSPRGGSRSETSSPGKASCCSCVFMSPGSTAYTRRSGRSTARTLVSCSSAAFSSRSRPSPRRPRRRRRT